MGGRRQEGHTRHPRNTRMEETGRRQRKMKASSEGGLDPERAVAPQVGVWMDASKEPLPQNFRTRNWPAPVLATRHEVTQHVLPIGPELTDPSPGNASQSYTASAANRHISTFNAGVHTLPEPWDRPTDKLHLVHRNVRNCCYDQS
jgi:hypothetical protein